MKSSGKGIIGILVFLVAGPGIVNVAPAAMIGEKTCPGSAWRIFAAAVSYLAIALFVICFNKEA